MRISQDTQHLELEKTIKSNTLTLLELSEKFGISERTLKSKLKVIFLNCNKSYLEKVNLFREFNIRIPKEIIFEELQRILKTQENITIKELADRLKISRSSVKNILKSMDVRP